MLTIQGKANTQTIKNLIGDHKTLPNEGWFFVDYATEPVALNSKFDVLLKGTEKELIPNPGVSIIKLVQCVDQFGHVLKTIPQGYKTICKFTFTPTIPTVIKNIKTLKEWDYNPAAVSFASHKDIRLADSDIVRSDLYSIILVQLRSSLNTQTKIFPRKHILDLIEKKYNTHSGSANNIIDTLFQLGKVNKKENDQIELVEV